MVDAKEKFRIATCREFVTLVLADLVKLVLVRRHLSPTVFQTASKQQRARSGSKQGVHKLPH